MGSGAEPNVMGDVVCRLQGLNPLGCHQRCPSDRTFHKVGRFWVYVAVYVCPFIALSLCQG